jgi:HAD superfamily hydrolase (TIGR01509 family)
MIPYHAIDTLFLDAGNTLVSIDFDWIARELAARGVPCAAAALRRAEAAARPGVSARLQASGERTRVDFSFEGYLDGIFEALERRGVSLGGRRAALVEELAPILHAPGRSAALWRWVIPDVPDALTGFRRLGLRLVVVSNSDGTVVRALEEQGLASHFDAICDSALVGFEKPDPRLFAHALEVSGARPERTLHVGDLYSADVVGARAAGLHALLLDPFDDWGPLDVPRLPDLAALLRAVAEARG